MTTADATSSKLIRRAIILCALGYFIDIFDIQLFAVLRQASLTDIGIAPDQIPVVAGHIVTYQMIGMILGGFIWGWLGDKYGRLKALYGSILIYSLGTLGCGFVQDPITYGVLRFISGFGLAGETGAAITLIAELMPAQKRGWGITITAGFGFLGPVGATLLSWVLGWRETYIVGGLIGLGLLALRMKLVEPEMFRKNTVEHPNLRGSWKLLAQPRQAMVFACCIAIGIPLIYTWNILNFFSIEFSKSVLADGEIFNQKICLLSFFIGGSLGDFLSGAISQVWKSRRKTIVAFLLAGVVTNAMLLVVGPIVKLSAPAYYTLYFTMGLAAGCWVLFATVASEHFGTNIRATTSITITNLVRGFTIPLVFGFQYLRAPLGTPESAALIGLGTYIVAFLALRQLDETHGLDLDYVEKLDYYDPAGAENPP